MAGMSFKDIDFDLNDAFPQLRSLLIHDTGIDRIPIDPSVGHEHLWEIDMPNNQIEMLPNNALQNFPRLVKVDLSNNPLTTLGYDSIYAHNINSFATRIIECGCVQSLGCCYQHPIIVSSHEV